MRERWPNQQRCAERLPELLKPGARIVVSSPTGTGKSTCMCDDIMRDDASVGLFTNRRMLLEQTARVLEQAGVPFGVMAAGYPADHSRRVQLCSMQSVAERALKRDRWTLPKFDRIHFDEAHVNKEATAMEIGDRCLANGAALCGWTATPLNIGHFYDQLFVAGKVSEGRDCGALVMAHTFAPDEPDCKGLKRTATGEYTQGEIVKRIMSHTIIGRVIENWRKLNPDGRPTLLFAPGVPESLWFAEHLTEKGIPAAHIDGEKVWLNGKLYESDQEMRSELKRLSQGGEIEIVCNRFVMREGIDWPHIEHLILATIFGALSGYLQSAGRGLRASPSTGKTRLVVQDHGGNFHRHGSVNSDREWCLDHTDYIVGELREQRMREKKEFEPITCPKCHSVRNSGPVCKQCGFQSSIRTRLVVQKDGSLKEMKGEIYRARPISKRPDGPEIWKRMYWRSRTGKGERSFNAAMALFAYENNWQYPDPSWPFMPTHDLDRFMLVKDVPFEKLTPGSSASKEHVA